MPSHTPAADPADKDAGARPGAQGGDVRVGDEATRLPSLGRDALSGRLETALAELEGATDAGAAWKRAWMLTAVGRYGEAFADCDLAMAGPPLMQTAALMTQGMLFRQVALHERAEEADRQALDTMRHNRQRAPALRAAVRIGQVADAVGMEVDRATLSRRLQVATAATGASGSWRQGVRLTWVRGEVLMVRDAFDRASRVFAAGARVARAQGAHRHLAKSLIFLAASRAAVGDVDEAQRMAERGLQLAAQCGAAPLIWPAELILAQVDEAQAERHLARARQFAGGVLDTLPSAYRAEAMERPPASWLLIDAGDLPGPDEPVVRGAGPATDA